MLRLVNEFHQEDQPMKLRLLSTLAFAVLATTVIAAGASGGGRGKLFQYRGELLNASSTTVSVQVEGGNRAALRSMLGQSQNQTFTLGPKSEVLIWRKGIPTVGTTADLKQGDWITVNVRAHAGSPLAEVESHPVGIVADRVAKPNPPSKPLYLYVGTVAGPQSGGRIALHVQAGNRRALRTMIGQAQDQTFTYGDETIFLLWQGKVPTVIDAAQLKAGARITVRIRAPKGSTLAQVEATAANHVGDHEPGNPATQN
jgi:hypothetical protein